MEYKGRKGSSNVEDRRGKGKGGIALAGGGIGGLILILIITFLGGSPSEVLNDLQGADSGPSVPYEETAEEKELAEFVSVVLADTEVVWTKLFREQGLEYEEPILVLYTDSVQSACGAAGASVGPFYCPGDHKLYIDLSFYQELQDKFQAPGDFAMAYVVAHEVGHHVQTLLGINEQVNALRPKLSTEEFNKYSVRLELQADYFAGVWARHQKDMNFLEEGDLDEAITAASAVGDDRIQEQAQGYIVPDSFTHGTSEQRKRWFTKGFENGTIESGDTFKASGL
ncbi:neutral zinc metallopeptidase [Sporosarcina sp. resist]|uniref:KPN_02809 family neutral zinc metallopeptidase n=1 Tax=Sporosarcina sp. resist TaxID=2762563 RepID=UPI00164D2797|nr:neutral zinc metallopeptidase [Sporosarcina sp. resist]QNK90318.1 neutral zinc metallopeptidase [Sporosarcina sp. resist]